MKGMDRDVAIQVRKAVEHARQNGAAGLQVRIVERSGAYPDVPLLAGILGAAVALEVALFSDLFVWPFWVVPIAIAGGAAGYAAARRWGAGLLRWVLPRRRRLGRVREAALAAFVDEALPLASGGTAALIFCSVQEEIIEVVPDPRLQARTAADRWARIRLEAARADRPLVDRLLATIETTGRLVSRAMPADEEQDGSET